MPYWYLPIIFLFLIIYFTSRQKRLAIVSKMIKNKKSEDTQKMKELAKNFIGKDCLIYAFDSSHQYSGIIKEVSDGAVLVENNGSLEAINLDFVIRIREFPKDKKGKKKSVVLD
jgi:hypothetical protein